MPGCTGQHISPICNRALADVLPVLYLRRLGGTIFIVIGIAMFCEWL